MLIILLLRRSSLIVAVQAGVDELSTVCICLPEGGMKEISLHTNRQYSGGLVGCVSHFTLSTDYHLALVEDAADGKNINTCSN